MVRRDSPKVTGVFRCGHSHTPENTATCFNKTWGYDQERCRQCHLVQARRWYDRKGRKMRMERRAAAK